MWWWIGFAYLLVATAWVFLRVRDVHRAMMQTSVGKREGRLARARMLRAAGCWEFGVGWVLVAAPGAGWAIAITVFGVGLLLLASSEMSLRHGLDSETFAIPDFQTAIQGGRRGD